MGGRNASTKIVTTIASTVTSFIPFLNALPTIPAGVGMLILTSRREDRQKYEEEKAAAQKQAELLARQQASYERRYMRQTEAGAERAPRRAANEDEAERAAA